MIIKEGKYYRDKNGTVYGPLLFHTDSGCKRYYFLGAPSWWTWDKNGKFASLVTNDYDLVEEVEVTPVAPKTATFYVAARRWGDNTLTAVARDKLDAFGVGYGPAVAVELELPPKPEGTRP
jgi:hypothetical protein